MALANLFNLATKGAEKVLNIGPIKQRIDECVVIIHMIDNVHQSTQQISSQLTQLKTVKEDIATTYDSMAPFLNDFFQGGDPREKLYSLVNITTQQNNPFEQISRAKSLMVNAVNTLLNLGSLFLPVVPSMVALIVDVSGKVRDKVAEIKVEVDKLMAVVDVAQQVLNGVNIFEQAKKRLDEVVRMVYEFVNINNMFESLKNEIVGAISDWQGKANDLQQKLVELQGLIQNTAQRLDPNALRSRITNPQLSDVNNLLGFISRSFTPAQAMQQIQQPNFQNITNAVGSRLQPQIDYLRNLVQTMRADVAKIPRWISQTLELKDRLFAFVKSIEEKLIQIKNDMEILKNPAALAMKGLSHLGVNPQISSSSQQPYQSQQQYSTPPLHPYQQLPSQPQQQQQSPSPYSLPTMQSPFPQQPSYQQPGQPQYPQDPYQQQQQQQQYQQQQGQSPMQSPYQSGQPPYQSQPPYQQQQQQYQPYGQQPQYPQDPYQQQQQNYGSPPFQPPYQAPGQQQNYGAPPPFQQSYQAPNQSYQQQYPPQGLQQSQNFGSPPSPMQSPYPSMGVPGQQQNYYQPQQQQFGMPQNQYQQQQPQQQQQYQQQGQQQQGGGGMKNIVGALFKALN